MSTGAIDFRKLLKEEKENARKKHQQDTSKSSQPTKADVANSIVANSTDALNPAATTLLTPGEEDSKKYSIREEDVEAIDFEKLKERLQHEQLMADSWSIPTVFDRKEHLICSNPPNIFYLANFIPQDQDQNSLLKWLQSLPENPHSSSTTQDATKANGTWTAMQYAKRRVALFDSQVAAFPAPLQRICHELVQQGIFPQPPNHVLINEYHPGQGIMPHTDGPAYLSRTATLSLGSDVLIQFTPRPNYDLENHPLVSHPNKLPELRLEKGCLLVFEDSAYLDYCHGIEDRVLEEEVSPSCLNAEGGTIITRGYRISLTFRYKKN